MAILTLMAVHAHPDDEALSTGGILALYARQGIRTVLVTCTDGGCGDGADGAKPDQPGFDRAQVVTARQQELTQSASVLGITDLESLGYPDSGMMGWPQNDAQGSFWTTPVDEAASRLAELMCQYRPQVVVTYDANGFYGHPDHIQAHRITMRAAASTGVPDKVYFTAVPKSAMADFAERIRELGLDPSQGDAAGNSTPEPVPEPEWGTPDDEITTRIDVSSVSDHKFDSLLAHASQSDNIFFLKMGRTAFSEIMGSETFVRAMDRSGAPTPEDDLFAGLR
ncbi:MAG: PIG-L family deacetylase [Acidimicrobiales bacterium]